MTSNPLPHAVDLLLEATVAGSFSRLGYEARRRLDDWEDPPPGALAGKRILLTGATSGIGRASTGQLLDLGAEVLVVGRDEQRTIRAVAELGIAHPHGTASAHIAALADLGAVRKLADELVAFGEPFDAIVHNAGALLADKTVTADGLETTLAVHLVAPHLLTERLTPLLRAPARVLWVTSGGMYSQGLDVDDLEMDAESYKGTAQYARAKRAQVELLGLWSERLAPTAVVHAMHPGWADTPGVETSLPTFRKVTGPALRTPDQGADTLVWLLWADEPARTSGELWLDRRPRSTVHLPGTGTDDQERARLWEWVAAAARS
jgi:NAD(P)-dependent dehydrogenase (short-subunit alcohol dehydrogenase family)